ncbi:mechanosensitive ion channel family protein [Methanoplanus sp. FWC-SCC4]|uniref:Mechanosensitive ion channel family protein n=1 Tax=Methanochimaera problematica TaxID=2609417 RepID=A0AA97FBJ3_9EURY|nr:mechanosensitive ion channel family protein [Methanoplanus sp. FWC-SCC4]WOF16385.1 mechanosensitive ion channel family protein [Methanoplanus sp. FWC-SCC4]
MNEIFTYLLEIPVGSDEVVLRDVLFFLTILFISFIIGTLLSKKIRKEINDKMPVNDRELIVKIIYFVIVVSGFLIALPYLNLDLSGLLVAGGIIGIVLGLAGQTVISNFFSGIIIFIEQPIKIGDNIGIGDILGTVQDIRILSTIIKTYDGIYTRVPNQTLFTSNITNFVAHIARRFEYIVGIRYQDDAEKAISVIKEMIYSHPFALKSPEPSVFVDDLGENGVNISVRIWAPSSVWWDVRTEMLWKIKVALEENGIEIPFPQRTVWFPEEKDKIQIKNTD